MAAYTRRLSLIKNTWKFGYISRCSLTLAEHHVLDYSPMPKKIRDPVEVAPKAFIILPEYQTRDLDKNLWLTKSTLRKELPESLKNCHKVIHGDDLRSLKQSFQECVHQKFGFQKEDVRRRGSLDEEVKSGVIPELLRCSFSHFYSSRIAVRHLRESFLDMNPQVITHWKRRGQQYQLKTRPAYILWTRHPMDLLDEEFGKTEDIKLPLQCKPDELDVYTHSYVPLKNTPGCQNRQQNLFPYCHTMILSCANQTPSQMQSNAILNMFSLLVSHALDDGNTLGKDLENPLATKCIVTDGTQLMFMCYQLNTLYFGRNKSDCGVKNIAWSTNLMELFKKRAHNMRKKKALIYESISPGTVLPEFNEECFRNWISFLVHRTV